MDQPLPLALATPTDPVAVDPVRIAALVNAVYAEAERGMWAAGAERTSAEAVRGLVLRGELVVATSGGAVVGVAHLTVAQGTGWLGMLAVDPAVRGARIGSRLLEHGERTARDAGASRMQVEVLAPLDASNASKIALDRWYRAVGFEHRYDEEPTLRYPALAPLLATACTLRVFVKPL